MAKTTKRDWIFVGTRILSRYGAQELTVEALCSEIGLTKGSFYHHFRGIDDYLDQFLIYFEQEGTLQIIDDVNREPTPAARLRKLIELSTAYPPELEVAMRAWALQDDLVRRVFERVDQQRIAYVQGLWLPIVGPDKALILAQLFYSVLIGGEHILPPLERADQKAVFDLLLEQHLPPEEST